MHKQKNGYNRHCGANKGVPASHAMVTITREEYARLLGESVRANVAREFIRKSDVIYINCMDIATLLGAGVSDE